MFQQPLPRPASMSLNGCVMVVFVRDRGNPLQDLGSSLGTNILQQRLYPRFSALGRLLEIFQNLDKSPHRSIGIPITCFLAISNGGNYFCIQESGLLQQAFKHSGIEGGISRSAKPAFAK